MSRSRRPQCPHGRARCGVCSGIVGAGRRRREAQRHADAIDEAIADADEWSPDSGAWEPPHMDRL